MTGYNDGLCESCRFWEPTSAGDRGWCRRKSPVPFLGEKNRDALWPMTTDTDWCGEYRKRKAPR
jgi:hypothetical protein